MSQDDITTAKAEDDGAQTRINLLKAIVTVKQATTENKTTHVTLHGLKVSRKGSKAVGIEAATGEHTETVGAVANGLLRPLGVEAHEGTGGATKAQFNAALNATFNGIENHQTWGNGEGQNGYANLKAVYASMVAAEQAQTNTVAAEPAPAPTTAAAEPVAEPASEPMAAPAPAAAPAAAAPADFKAECNEMTQALKQANFNVIAWPLSGGINFGRIDNKKNVNDLNSTTQGWDLCSGKMGNQLLYTAVNSMASSIGGTWGHKVKESGDKRGALQIIVDNGNANEFLDRLTNEGVIVPMTNARAFIPNTVSAETSAWVAQQLKAAGWVQRTSKPRSTSKQVSEAALNFAARFTGNQ